MCRGTGSHPMRGRKTLGTFVLRDAGGCTKTIHGPAARLKSHQRKCAAESETWRRTTCGAVLQAGRQHWGFSTLAELFKIMKNQVDCCYKMLAMGNRDESCFCGWLVTEIEVQVFYCGPECESGSVVHKWSKQGHWS